MLLRRAVVAVLAVAVLGPFPLAAQAAPPTVDPKLTYKKLPRPERPRADEALTHDPHTVLVRFKRGASAAAQDRALKSRGARGTEAVGASGYVKAHTNSAAAELLRALRNDPAVESVALDYRRQLAATPNDPAYAYGDQNYLKTVRLPQAWDRTKGSTTQVIAVVDTGVDVAHPDLTGRTVPGYNAVSPGSAPSDTNGHGTMVAGIAAANTNNGAGIAGAAWTGRIMPIKVFGSNGYALDSHIATGIRWAVDRGAKIVNLSLGGPGDSPVLHDAVKYATGKGAVVVVAAGNDGDDTPQYPAAYPEVLAVGATDSSGVLTDFSSWGDWIDVAAPGFDIISTYPAKQYAIGDGTSFSAPIVSGVAALVRTMYPTMTPAQVISRIKTTARDAGPRGIDPYYGYGIVDAYHAVGGTWGSEFSQPALGTGEPNDVPARATALSTSVTGTMAREGDVDWYRYDADERKAVEITVQPPPNEYMRAQNFDPIVAVYDEDLRLLGEVDSPFPGATEKIALTLAPGRHYISVRNYNGAPDTRSYTVAVNATTAPLFAPAQSTRTGSSAQTTAVGDVTGDGRNDVVLATSFYFDEVNDYKLFVFEQQADGSLAAPVRYATRLQYGDSAGLALLDADGDGRLDVALATKAGVEIFRQNEAGVLENKGVLLDTTDAKGLVAADMDADGDSDLVTNRGSDILMLTRKSDGSFTQSVVATDSVEEVKIGDVNGDGRPDVVTFQGSTINVYHRTDTGWSRTDHATGSARSTWGIEVADVTGDGRADILASIFANPPEAQVIVLPQNPDGGLDAPVPYTIGDMPEPVGAADINGDGRTDVVVLHSGGRLSVRFQQPDGKLAPPIAQSSPYATHYSKQGMALGDITGDGRVDVAIANSNYGLVLLRNDPSTSPRGEQLWVRDVSPSDFATGVVVAPAVKVTFQRAVDPESVTASSVRLVNGRTGAAVAATPAYDEASGSVTLTPAAALQDNTPYRIVVDGVRDTSGEVQSARFSTTFRTVDVAPAPVTSLTAAGFYPGARLSWKLPNITDLDQVIVRMATGSTPPSSITSGTSVYAGTGSSVTVTGVTAGTTYSFQVWVRDRSGKLSTGATLRLRLLATAQTVSSSATAINYGGSVRVTGRLSRKDTGAAITGAPVELYGRRKGSTSWVLLGTAKSSSTGGVSFSHKPSWSLDYRWIYRGSPQFAGVASSYRAVGVRVAVSATLSRTSFARGGSVKLSGKVSPSHAGKTVYLQRYVNGKWTTVTSRKLSSTSSYSFTIKPSSRGTYKYRVYRPADTDHLSRVSSVRSFKVY